VKVSPSLRKLPLSMASMIALSALTPAVAQAAGPIPNFQLPLPCGQTWRASTYTQHWNGDQDALDFAQRDGSQNNLSRGEYALAAAAGEIDVVHTVGGEHRVYVDHGGGWRTAYIHLKELPPLTVGQRVAQGEVIGLVSNSGTGGTNDEHLHYNQFRDGTTIRATFNGQLVDTHAGDSSTWGHWGSASAEAITSVNCVDNSFAAFYQNGIRYQILYKPSTGEAKVMEVESDGSAVTNVWTGNWGQRWTHIIPFDLSGGQQHIFRYKASTGEFRFDSVNNGALGFTSQSSGTWWAGWTNITPFRFGGKPYLLVYDQVHGYANIEKINATGSGTTNLSQSTWSKGWTHFVPYVQGPTLNLLTYKGGNGEAKVNTITGTENDLTLTTVWDGTWTTGLSHLVPLSHQGSHRLFTYSATTGQVTYNQLLANGQGIQQLGSSSWTTSWTSFTPMLLSNGDAGVFIYRGALGSAQLRRFNAAGNSSTDIWNGSWTTGWR
jgi:hypothetical protein